MQFAVLPAAISCGSENPILYRAGARDTMTAILGELEKQKVTDVAVTQTGCIGLCEYEPIVQVQIGEGEMVTYGKLSADRVSTLIQKHVVGGEPIVEWAIKQTA